MVRLRFTIELRYEIAGSSADFIFNVHATQTQCQSLVSEEFRVSQDVPVSLFIDPAHGNRYARLRADPGNLVVRYEATVDIAHYIASVDSIGEVAE